MKNYVTIIFYPHPVFRNPEVFPGQHNLSHILVRHKRGSSICARNPRLPRLP